MAFSDIENKAELAVVRHLNSSAALLAGVTIHANVDNSDLPLPHIVAAASSCDEHPKFSGNYIVDLTVHIESNTSDSTPSQHTGRVAVVRDQFSNDWVGASLSGHVSDFAVQGGPGSWGVVIDKAEQQNQDDRFIHRIALQIYCRPSD